MSPADRSGTAPILNFYSLWELEILMCASWRSVGISKALWKPTAYLKDLGAKLVVSRAARDVQARFLLRNGADEVVYPEKQLANWTAIRYSSEHIFDYIQLSDDHAIFEISIPENWVGKTVGNIDIRKKYNITIMALKRDGKLEMSITPDTVLDKDVTMLVLGASRDIQKCFHI